MKVVDKRCQLPERWLLLYTMVSSRTRGLSRGINQDQQAPLEVELLIPLLQTVATAWVGSLWCPPEGQALLSCTRTRPQTPERAWTTQWLAATNRWLWRPGWGDIEVVMGTSRSYWVEDLVLYLVGQSIPVFLGHWRFLMALKKVQNW